MTIKAKDLVFTMIFVREANNISTYSISPNVLFNNINKKFSSHKIFSIIGKVYLNITKKTIKIIYNRKVINFIQNKALLNNI